MDHLKTSSGHLIKHRGFLKKTKGSFKNIKIFIKKTNAICRKCGKLVEISRNSLRRFIDSNGVAHEIWLLFVQQAFPNKPLA